jgi:hypothetical protein
MTGAGERRHGAGSAVEAGRGRVPLTGAPGSDSESSDHLKGATLVFWG